MTDPLLSALSLARKAGALAGGFDAVLEAIACGDARLVLLAQDISPRTGKKVQAACAAAGQAARGLPLAQAQIAQVMHKPVGVLCVTDENLAALCIKKLEQQP